MGNEASSARHGQHAGNPTPAGPPPVSGKHLAKYLKPINVTGDDLKEETNKECVVCLGEQVIGDPASKLPCGHLFHVGCVEQWLRLHCTCPVCRFELETDDSYYEMDRKDRMQGRKLRYRRDELDKKSITALKEIMAGFNINSANCFDKRDLVDRLVASGHIEIVEASPAIELTDEELNSKSIRQLTELMLSLGVSTDGAIEKSDLIRRLLDSGRVVSVVKMEVEEEIKAEANVQSHAAVPHIVLNKREVEQVLHQMSTRDLRNLLHSNNIDTSRAVEREDLINSFMLSGIDFTGGGEAAFQATSTHVEFETSAGGGASYFSRTEYAAFATATSSSDSAVGSKRSFADSGYSGSPDGRVTTLSVRELKDVSAALGIDISMCLDKADIINKLKESGHQI